MPPTRVAWSDHLLMMISNIFKIVLEWLDCIYSKLFPALNEPVKSDDQIRPLHEVPGPKCLPLIGTIYTYFPYIGEFEIDMYSNAIKRYQKYGSIVRESFFGVDVVHIYDPDDIETLMKYSGKYPERRGHLGSQKYRLSNPAVYNGGGLLSSNGQEWKDLRMKFQNAVSSPQNVAKYIDITNCILDEFVEMLKLGQMNNDFLISLSRLNLQLIGVIAFDVKLEAFSEEGLREDSMISKLLASAEMANSLTFSLDVLPDFMRNKYNSNYRKACECFSYIERVAVEFIRLKKAKFNHEEFDENDSSLLEKYLASPGIDSKDIIGMCVDFLLAGFDTTSYSMSFALYHLSTHPKVQQKLYEETKRLLPNLEDKVTKDVLAAAAYTKAVLKESLRLNPISIGIGRHLTQEVVLSGYRIPIGTSVVTNNQVACHLDKYFDEPEKFLPERWLKGSPHYKSYHSFLSIPFGNGSRMCIAKRLAEQNMYITLMKLVRNFDMIWVGEEMKIASSTINKPAVPLKIVFQPRND